MKVVGHYGNVISLKDVAQWSDISVELVVNCTNHVMAAVLAHHDHLVSFPTLNSQDAKHAQCFVKS
jgi:CobQ-like glutamine amidotransferase family enzyme